MDLVALADFTAVVAHGGFAAASRATGAPKATLSRRVRALESHLQTRLLERGKSGLTLTQEGADLHRRTGPLLAEILQTGEEMSGRSGVPRGRLRVSAPVLLANLALGRIAADFVRAYPEIDLEIVADDRQIDPIAEGFDVVIRANPATDTALVGHRILHDDLVVAAHPGITRPISADAAFPAVVLSATPLSADWLIETDAAQLRLRPRPRLRVSSMSLAHQAALSGAGAAILPLAVARADIAANRLVLWGRLCGRHAETWILHAARRLQPAKIATFVQFVRSAFPDQRL